MFGKSIFRAVAVFMIMAMVNLMVGCNGTSEKSPVESNEITSLDISIEQESESAEPVIDNSEYTVLYHEDDEFQTIMDELTSEIEIQNAMNDIEQMGYVYSVEYSIIVENTNNSELGSPGFAAITMIADDGSENNVIYIGVSMDPNERNVDA